MVRFNHYGSIGVDYSMRLSVYWRFAYLREIFRDKCVFEVRLLKEITMLTFYLMCDVKCVFEVRC